MCGCNVFSATRNSTNSFFLRLIPIQNAINKNMKKINAVTLHVAEFIFLYLKHFTDIISIFMNIQNDNKLNKLEEIAQRMLQSYKYLPQQKKKFYILLFCLCVFY